MNRDEIAAFITVSLDPAVTYAALRAGAHEAHPLWAALVASYGVGGGMALRFIIGVVFVAALTIAVRSDVKGVTGWTLRVLTVAFSIIVVWNLLVWVTA